MLSPDISLCKLQEYYTNFRAICDTFTIDASQLKDIFPHTAFLSTLSPFISESGLIDGLELFAFLAIFCKDSFEEKTKFLFDIFDFNDLNSISVVDFEFLLSNVLGSVFKAFGLVKPINRNDLLKTINRKFNRFSLINISHILSFALDNEEVTLFFDLINREPPTKNRMSVNEVIWRRESKEECVPSHLLQKKFKFNRFVAQDVRQFSNSGLLVFSSLAKTRNELLASVMHRAKIEQSKNYSVQNCSLKLEWVYGFPSVSHVRSFCFHKHSQSKDKSCQHIVYPVENVVVVLEYKANKQRHYKEHACAVNSVCVSAGGLLCASGDQGTHPKVHVWLISSLKTVSVLSAVPDCSVYLMTFANNDRYLVCLGNRPDPPLTVFDLTCNSVVLTTWVSDFALTLSPILCLKGLLEVQQPTDGTHFGHHCAPVGQTRASVWDMQSSFVVSTRHRIDLFTLEHTTQTFDCFSLDFAVTHPNDNINCCLAVFQNQINPEFSLSNRSEDFGLVALVGFQSGTLMTVSGWGSQRGLVQSVAFSAQGAVQAVVMLQHRYLVMAVEGQGIKLLDCNSSAQPNTTLLKLLFEFPLSDLGVRFKDMRVKNVEVDCKRTLFVSTLAGEIAKVSLPHSAFRPGSGLQKVLKCQLIRLVGCLPSGLSAMCTTQANDLSAESFVYVASKDSTVNGFSRRSKQLVDSWSVEGQVTAIDCFTSQSKNVIFAVGVKSGRVFIRYDWELYFKSFNCGDSITCLRFSRNGLYLVAGSVQFTAYIFCFAHGSLFEYNPKEVSFGDEVPLSVDFGVDNRVFLVGTDKGRFYEVTVEGTTSELISESSKLQNSELRLKYNFAGSGKSSTCTTESVWGIVFVGELDGSIAVYNSLQELSDNTASYYYGHAGRVADLMMTEDKTRLISFATKSRAVFEWKVHKEFTFWDKDSQHDSTASEAFPADCPSLTRTALICTSPTPHFPKFEDSFASFRGFTNAFLRKIFGESSSLSQDDKRVAKVYPPASLQLSHVYGFEGSDLRNCVLFVLPSLVAYTPFREVHPQFDQRYCRKFDRQPPPPSIVHLKQKPAPKPLPKGQLQTVFGETSRDKLDEHFNLKSALTVDNDQRPVAKSPNVVNAHDQQRPVGTFEDPPTPGKSNHQMPKLVELNRRNAGAKLGNAFRQPNVDSNVSGLHDESVNRQRGSWEFVDSPSPPLVLYPSSRVAIVIDPRYPNLQRFYQGHDSRISALCIHSRYRLVASAEASFNPKVHVWDPFNQQNVALIDTHHRVGVVLIKFSVTGHFVFTASVDKLNSVQVSDWSSSQPLAFRNTSKRQITALEVSPSSPTSFVTGSRGCVDLWRFKHYSIIHKRSIDLTALVGNAFVSTLTFLTYTLDYSLKDDILFTTSTGQIGMLSKGVPVFCKPTTSDSTINVVKLVQVNGNLLVWTASTDNVLRVFDIQMNQLQAIELDRLEAEQWRETGVSSFDLVAGDNRVCAVVGLTVGRIVELELTPTDPKGTKDCLFKCKAVNLVYSHSCSNSDSRNTFGFLFSKRIAMAVHPVFPINVSVGSDKQLKVWDLDNHIMLEDISLVRYLNASPHQPPTPTCLKFSIKGDSLVVGFDDSSLLTLMIKVTRSVSIQYSSHAVTVSPNGLLMRDERIQTAVLSVAFSPKGSFMAVSFDNQQPVAQDQNSLAEKNGALIVIYEVANSRNESNERLWETEVVFRKRRELRLASLNSAEMSKMSVLGNACHFMTFSEDEFYLMVYYQNVNQGLVRENLDTEGRYMIWNHETAVTEMNWEVLKNVDFKHNVFPTHCFGKRLFHNLSHFPKDHLQTGTFVAKPNSASEQRIVLSSVNCRNGSVVVMGSQQGELFLVKSTAFALPATLNPETLDLDQLCQAKKYMAHSTFVDQIEFTPKGNALLTTSLSDECLMQWAISETGGDFELDQRDVDTNTHDDVYQEVRPSDNFDTILSDVYHPRVGYSELLTNVDLSVFPKFNLTLSKVFGRRAFDRRSNLCFSRGSQLIYSAGTQIVFVDLSHKQQLTLAQDTPQTDPGLNKTVRFKAESDSPPQTPVSDEDESNCNSSQHLPSSKRAPTAPHRTSPPHPPTSLSSSELLHSPSVHHRSAQHHRVLEQQFALAESENDVHAPGEVSSLSVSADRGLLCVGTSESMARLCFWQTTSKSFVGKVSLFDCVSVLLSRFSTDCKYLAALGLTRSYCPVLYYVGVDRREVLSLLVLSFSSPSKVKDIDFVTDTNDEFVSVGVVHASRWSFAGGVLGFRELRYEEPYDSIRAYHSDQNHSRTAHDSAPGFLCIKHIESDLFLTTCMKGFVYCWVKDEVVIKRMCFRESPAVCLAVSPTRQHDFIVGGYGVPLLYYRLFRANPSTVKMIVVFQVSLFESVPADPFAPCFQLQSLIWIEQNHLVFGTRSGKVGQVFLDSQRIDQYIGFETQVLRNDDLSLLKPEREVMLSAECLFDFTDDEVPNSVDFSKTGKEVFVFTGNGTFVTYDLHSMRMLKKLKFDKRANTMLVLSDTVMLVFERKLVLLDIERDFRQLDQFEKDTLAPINKAKTNPLNDMLALAFFPHSDLPSLIEVYRIESTLVKHFSIQTDEVQLLDFSVNNVYLMYQELNGKSYILNVNVSKLEVQNLDNDDPIEWTSDGFHLNEKRKCLNQSYGEESEIVSITKLRDAALVVSDTLGTVS